MTSSEPGYQVETASRYTVVTLSPQLSNERWGDIHEVGNQLVKRLNDLKTPTLLVDLSAMEYIGSSTVALVVRLWKAVKEHEGALAVISKHPVVLEVLQIAGLNKVWTIVESRDEALSELGVRVGAKGGLLTYVGLIVAAVAVAGLAIQFSPDLKVPREVMLGMLFGGAGVGLLLGLLNTFREAGFRRMLSLIALIACLAIGIIGFAKVSGWSIELNRGGEKNGAGNDGAASDKAEKNETGKDKAEKDDAEGSTGSVPSRLPPSSRLVRENRLV